MPMDELNVDDLCVICLMESQAYYSIYDRHVLDNSLIIEVINDVCQLDITMEDESPQFICSECCTKMLDFHSFKREVHKARATYLKLKENSQKTNSAFEENHIYIDINVACEDAVTPKDNGSDSEQVSIKQDDCEGNNMNMENSTKGQWEDSENEIGIDIEETNVDFLYKLEDEVPEGEENGEEATIQDIDESISAQMGSEPVEIPDQEGSLASSSQVYESSQNHSKQVESIHIGKVRRNLNTDQDNEHRKHTGIHKEKIFGCHICGTEFIKRKSLLRHLISHPEEKAFECNQCGKRFVYNCELIKHSRFHSGERIFECLECGKKFTFRANLINHQRIHTGEKPYECPNCGKRFNLRNSLVRHYRIHTGEKPYECSICRRKFNAKSSLVRHWRVHSDGITFAYSS